MQNYIYKFSIIGVEFYRNTNNGRWYYKKKNGNMKMIL
ncbi:glucan-binding YG repeat protein [Geomicrobium halophilum]|uniref:Glucan-binding YG repeat protein n=1 Tax=Geomicrobium halophilum TaxID=549000 RepID=A0A841Q1A8_9BACL|nr:glucan-binding YG repeat protein [Geomicrobium halophilum]